MTEETVGFVLNVTDVAGNTAVINQVTDGTSVTIDNTSPSVNYLGLSSNGAVNTYAKAGEVVTLSFQADEDLAQSLILLFLALHLMQTLLILVTMHTLRNIRFRVRKIMVLCHSLKFCGSGWRYNIK